MKAINYILFLGLALVCYSNGLAQIASKITAKDFKKEIETVRVNMNKEHAVIHFTKEVYRDEKTNKLEESATGVIYRGGGINYRMVSSGLTVLHLSDLILIVDSASHMIQISEPDSITKTIDMLGDISIDMLQKYEIEKTVFPAYALYKAVPKGFVESTLEFFVDTKTKRLYKLKMTLPESNYFSEDLEDESLEKPYVVMIYEPVQELKNEGDLFSFNQFVKKNEKGGFELTEAFSAYELHDSRYRPTN